MLQLFDVAHLPTPTAVASGNEGVLQHRHGQKVQEGFDCREDAVDVSVVVLECGRLT